MKFVGKKIGKVKVIEKCDKGVKGKTRSLKIYKCLCDCGVECMLSREQLTRNGIPACKRCSRKFRFKDLTGKIFGKWTVLKVFQREDYLQTRWLCKCECGNERDVNNSSLMSGRSTNCGCSRKKPKLRIDLLGMIFGRLTVIKKAEKQSMWICKCECGNEIITRSTSLKHGLTKSCGCIKIEMLSGENSRFWKGGIDNLVREFRVRSHLFDTWSKKIRKRDKVCKKCGSDEKLNAHHIINYDFDPSKGLDLDNGITLCEKCHKLYHKVYGKIENNIDQLNEFFKYE